MSRSNFDGLKQMMRDILDACGLDPERLSELAYSSSPFIRQRVAGNARTPSEDLVHLGNDPAPAIRRAVAANPNAPPELRALLALEGTATACDYDYEEDDDEGPWTTRQE